MNSHPTPATDADYWYTHRHDLESGQVFRLSDGSFVKLHRRVPGDGTQWYVADWSDGGWTYYDNTIEPGDLRGERLDGSPADVIGSAS